MFLSLDFSGALFSLLSLVVDKKFDMAGVMYCICMALEIGIFGCHGVWLLRRFRKRRKGKADAESVGEGNVNGGQGVVEEGVIIAGGGEAEVGVGEMEGSKGESGKKKGPPPSC